MSDVRLFRLTKLEVEAIQYMIQAKQRSTTTIFLDLPNVEGTFLGKFGLGYGKPQRWYELGEDPNPPRPIVHVVMIVICFAAAAWFMAHYSICPRN